MSSEEKREVADEESGESIISPPFIHFCWDSMILRVGLYDQSFKVRLHELEKLGLER